MTDMRVLLAYDDSAGARTARDLLAGIDLPSGTAITLAMVLQQPIDVFGAPGSGSPESSEAAAVLAADLQEMLVTASAPFRPRFRTDHRVLRGRPALALVAEAKAIGADLIVTGSRGHGPFASVLLGSVSTEIVDHAPCPVLVARRQQLRRVVIGADGSEGAQRAVELVRSWPALASVPIVVASVAANEGAWESAVGPSLVGEWPVALDDLNREAMEYAHSTAQAAADRLTASGIDACAEVRRGDAADQLIAAADSHGADLIVIGSRGLGTWSQLLLGSVAHKVVQHARQSVLVVRLESQPAGATATEPAADAIAV
jgi:nucleotide-binding universal stress UspA family protein